MRWKQRSRSSITRDGREEVAVTELTPDTDLRDIFPVSKRKKTALAAHEFLHQHRKAVIDKVAQWTGAQRPLIKTLMDTIEKRAGELDLRADKTRSAEHLAEVTAYVDGAGDDVCDERKVYSAVRSCWLTSLARHTELSEETQ